MKRLLTIAVVLLAASVCFAEPVKIVLMDFEDQTGMKSDARLGGAIAPGALAGKGVYLLTKELLGSDEFVLVDRRDFLSQVNKLRPADGRVSTPTKPSFIQAAQALNADVVLRGSLLSFSTAKQAVNQGGYQAELSTLSLRVAVEALSAVDGTVIAMTEGAAREKLRQTGHVQTVMSEDDVLELFRRALKKVVPELKRDLQERAVARASRPKVKMSIVTDADPVLLEIDGLLVGSTPVEELEVYQGDHVLTLGKPGYQDVTKRIMFEKDVRIEVPMIRTQLNADEMKEVMEKMRMSVVVGEPGIVIHELSE